MEWSSTSKGKGPGCQCEASCGNICPPCTFVIIRDSNLSMCCHQEFRRSGAAGPGAASTWE